MANKTDRRIQRTRHALVQAFTSLLLEPRRYDQIKVSEIVERADVGRSTFYEHYKSKEEILAESIQRPFASLAQSVDADCGVGNLRVALDHFWQNRSQARGIFGGAARRPVARVLATMIQARLTARLKAQAPSDALRIRLAAIALAEAQLGIIAVWLGGEIACSTEPVAQVLRDMARAVAAAT
jgi:AcrR family transcriptional regulator